MLKSKQDQDDKLLEEYLRMKPSRAIDRLLSEYSVEKAFTLYHLLQQKIKRNTTQLRSTLTQKYQNLVDCSNLLTTIKLFTDQIEAIQKNISHVFHQDPQLHQDGANSKKRSVVNVIEEKIYQKRYREAMRMSYTNSESVDESQFLYLPMLRIQILTCLQQEIIKRKFTKTFISQIILCIQEYISHLTHRETQQVINNQRKSGEILSLIAEVLQSKQDRSIVENDIIEVIFKCKLLSLHRNKHYHVREEQNISKFFHDILQLIAEKEKESEEISHLSAIFCKNYQQIEAHLLQTFIIKDKDKNISFRYELYERLATSEQFMETLEKLNRVISDSFSDAPKVTLRESFLNLWENYYNQLVDLLFKRCNPINFLPSLVVDKQKYSKEIRKYICSDELSIENRIKSYQTQLEFFFGNINQLLKQTSQLKSSKLNPNDIIEQIITLYSNKIETLNKSIAQFTEKISQQATLNKLGSLIFLFMYCDEFNSKICAHSQQKQMSLLKKIKVFDLRTNYLITKKFYPCFQDTSKKQSKWSINFDHFFMKYYNTLLKQSKREIIKNIILVLLQGTMQHMDREKTEMLLSQKGNKREQQFKEQQQRKNKLNDISPNDVKPTTFAKKKGAQSVPIVQGES